jgi:hypothetical protein
VRQIVPQPPQFVGSVLWSVQLEPHNLVDAEQPVVQFPWSQTWPDAHACPHEPQLLELLVVLTHVPPHVDSPAPQTAAGDAAGEQPAIRSTQPSAAPTTRENAEERERSLRVFMLMSLLGNRDANGANRIGSRVRGWARSVAFIP